MRAELLGENLKEFYQAFGASLDPRLWLELIKEETEELKVALKKKDRFDVLKEMSDLMYVQIGFNLSVVGAVELELIPPDEKKEMEATIDASDKVYNEAVEFMGVSTNFYEAFRRIHNSNMSKLGEDGKPIKREDGKILKGPLYKEPNLRDLV